VKRLSFGVLLIALATLVLELMLTRVFDVVLLPNISYFVVTAAVFAFGLAGIFVTLRPIAVTEDINGILFICSVAFALAIVLQIPIVNALQLDYTAIVKHPIQVIASFLALYVVAAATYRPLRDARAADTTALGRKSGPVTGTTAGGVSG
jgi:hypothetical protein